jgi:hypothetical protein
MSRRRVASRHGNLLADEYVYHRAARTAADPSIQIQRYDLPRH